MNDTTVDVVEVTSNRSSTLYAPAFRRAARVDHRAISNWCESILSELRNLLSPDLSGLWTALDLSLKPEEYSCEETMPSLLPGANWGVRIGL